MSNIYIYIEEELYELHTTLNYIILCFLTIVFKTGFKKNENII